MLQKSKYTLRFQSVESEEGRLTTSSPDITTDNGKKLLGTTFIIDDKTIDQDERTTTLKSEIIEERERELY